MRRTWSTCLAALRGNRGSSIVMVLVSMLVVSILGAALLYMSYTGFLIKATERQGKETFYDAAAAMTEIRSGIQEVVTASIAIAYNNMLTHYSDAGFTGDNMTEKFHQLFRTDVLAWRLDPSNADTTLFPLISGFNVCSSDVLKEFLTHPENAVLSAGTVRYDSSSDTMILRDISVSYTNPDNELTSNIISDIVIKMPDFYYLASEYSVSGIPEFAVIAKMSLAQVIGNSQLNIQGSAYAGGITLSGALSSLEITGGSLICKNNVTVADRGPTDRSRLTVTDDAALWAKRIYLNSAGSLSLEGTAYVADDLALEGDGAAALVSGSYYGFGQSTTDAAESSAIVINGRNTQLDFSQVSRLMLAGQSFVSDTTTAAAGAVSGQVMMGESVSVKSNQQAYLIPSEYLENISLNPTVLPASDSIPTATLSNAPLWTIDGVSKTLADYNITPKTVVLRRAGAGNQQVVYYFMQFASTTDANHYFKDYFTVNKDEITRYLAMYTDLSDLDGISQTSGYAIYQSEDGYKLRGYAARDSLTATSNQLTTMFAQLSKTLSTNPVSTTAADPYEYIVDQSKFSAEVPEGEHLWFYDGSDPVALAVNGAYTINESAPDTLRLILASGDVTVSQDFHGLIISGGTITMERSVYASEEDVVSAFSATNGDLKFSDFLNEGAGEHDSTEDGGSFGNWNLDGMVLFQNWSKH
ncbi:MAG: hypothetical protein VB071_15595 [Lawsonibacter sp.]|nr:hypothetical protein [Lawsonibacter sp.]